MFPNLKAEMARYNVSVQDIARVIEKTEKAVSGKLTGRTDFTWGEVLAIRNELFPNCSIDYLFSVEAKTA